MLYTEAELTASMSRIEQINFHQVKKILFLFLFFPTNKT